MSEVQQQLSGTTAQANETGGEMEVSQSESQAPMVSDHLRKDRERCQAQLNAVHHQRATTLEGLQKLDQQIEKATLAVNAADSTKLTNLHAKRRSFEQQLEELASQERILTQHLERVAQKEQASSIELHLTARRNAHHEGVAIADRLRRALGVVEGLYGAWREWAETERRLKDTLRSLAPDRMSECPNFSYVTAIDQNFEQAIGQALVELHRSQRELQRRPQAKGSV